MITVPTIERISIIKMDTFAMKDIESVARIKTTQMENY